MPDVIIDIVDQPNISSEGTPENKLMMYITKLASGLRQLEIVCVSAALQGGFAFMVQSKDFGFVALMLFFVGIRIFCGSSEHNMQKSALFYWFQLVSAIITGVISAIQLYSQDFGEIEEKYKVNRALALNVIYVVALAKAMLLLAWCCLLIFSKSHLGTEDENVN